MIYQDLHASLLRFCSDLTNQWVDDIPQFVNFDSAAEESLLPKCDLIGPLGLTFELDEHLLTGHVQIGYSSWNDANLFRLVERMDTILELLKPTCKIQVYDSTGEVTSDKGVLIVQNGTKLLPVVAGQSRPIQFIGVTFQSTLTFKDA